MIKYAIFGILSLLSFITLADEIANISQQTLLQSDVKNQVIIDVRSVEEFQHGHVPKAINVPLHEIVKDPTILPASKGQPIVLYCRSGKRAGKAASLLVKNGYMNISHLQGDMLAWIEAGLPVEQ